MLPIDAPLFDEIELFPERGDLQRLLFELSLEILDRLLVCVGFQLAPHLGQLHLHIHHLKAKDSPGTLYHEFIVILVTADALRAATPDKLTRRSLPVGHRA
jgi:hypothetical protein